MNIYIGTYRENGKEPVRFTVTEKEFKKATRQGETAEAVKERLSWIGYLRLSSPRRFMENPAMGERNWRV